MNPGRHGLLTLAWLLALLPLAVFGQEAEEPETATSETSEILGQPAGWAIEPEEAQTLVPIAAGSALKDQPQDAAGTLAILPEGSLPLLESNPPWVKVSHGDQIGWVNLEAPLSRPDRSDEPEPLQPRWQAGNIEPSGMLGSYTLWGTPPDPAELEYLDRIAREHLRLYGERYGLRAEAAIGGDIRLLSQMRDFVESHRDQAQGKIDIQGNGYFNAPALIVVFTGRSNRYQLAATLLHELTHLLNWHFFVGWSRPGARLAPWLDEGMAEELTFSMSDRQGTLQAEPLGPANLRFGRQLGALLRDIDLAIAKGEAPPLPTLVDMDHETFLSSELELHYAVSALFIRYLLSHSELADPFRAFLGLVTEGAAANSANLVTQLGRPWPELASGFHAWLGKQRMRFPAPGPRRG